jgi:hypothetical protein
MTKEFIIYCDESASFGTNFSNFYGGALIRSDHIDRVRRLIADKKRDLHFFGEVKWQKVTENYLEKYKKLMGLFFDIIEEDLVKVRIMFTQNIYITINLTDEHREHEYFILYYKFVKHAFGLIYSGNRREPTRVRLLLDQLPNTQEKCARFRGFLSSLTYNPDFRAVGIRIAAEDIVDVVSHNHDVLQCLDIVLGSINFRLNDLHIAIPPGKRRRGRKTRAKEALYKHINKRMCDIRPGFNIGISTGTNDTLSNRWHHSYRHWRFLPKDFEIAGTADRG